MKTPLCIEEEPIKFRHLEFSIPDERWCPNDILVFKNLWRLEGWLLIMLEMLWSYVATGMFDYKKEVSKWHPSFKQQEEYWDWIINNNWLND